MLKRITIAGLVAGLAMASPVLAADNAMQVCGARYQAAKTAKALPAGQTWPQFLAQCRGTLSRTAATPAPTVVAKAPVSAPGKITVIPKPAAAPKVTGQVSAAQLAARSRQKQCAQNYQADKSANRLAGQSWPRYYSACSARLKG